MDLVVGADVCGVELPEPGREGEGADEPDDGEGVDEAVLLQHRLDPLVAAQPQHVPARFYVIKSRLGSTFCLYSVAHLLWERNMSAPNLNIRLPVFIL